VIDRLSLENQPVEIAGSALQQDAGGKKGNKRGSCKTISIRIKLFVWWGKIKTGWSVAKVAVTSISRWSCQGPDWRYRKYLSTYGWLLPCIQNRLNGFH